MSNDCHSCLMNGYDCITCTCSPEKEEAEEPYPEGDDLWKKTVKLRDDVRVLPIGNHPAKPGPKRCDICGALGYHHSYCGLPIPEGECDVCYHWDGEKMVDSIHKSYCYMFDND